MHNNSNCGVARTVRAAVCADARTSTARPESGRGVSGSVGKSIVPSGFVMVVVVGISGVTVVGEVLDELHVRPCVNLSVHAHGVAPDANELIYCVLDYEQINFS